MEKAAWEEGFAHLAKFVEREGHARVSAGHRENEFNLGRWVSKQRTHFREGSLDATHRERLEALPGWVWDVLEAAWEEGYAHLTKFVKREGHARVPGGERENGYRLGQWVLSQRNQFRKGSLDTSRRDRLEAVPDWVWDTREAAWEEGFAAVERFVKREGHARVPKAHREDGFRLGAWVANQRVRKGGFDPERRERLEALPGWVWDVNEAGWQEGFAHLERFVEREGHAQVPVKHRENGYTLGQWVSVQRSALRKGKLDPKRQARLEAVPGWTWEAG